MVASASATANAKGNINLASPTTLHGRRCRIQLHVFLFDQP
jgi:hypothetical protein